MPAGVMLDDISLPLVQELRTLEDRAWVTHQVPGLDGAAHQHLGRQPLMITVTGAMVDDTSLAALEQLRQKFQAHEPVPFAADIATATEIKNVVIDDLRVTELAGRPQQYRYVLRLIEHIPPPPPVQPLAAPGVDLDATGILDQVTGLLDQLPELPGLLDIDLANPVPPLRTLLDGVTSTAGEIGNALKPLGELLGN
jgi:hypothetical protein